METVTLRVDEPREILALIPHQLGFQPRDSAVVVSLRGPRNQVGMLARTDLPDLADVRDGPQVARTLLAHLGRDGARRTMLVLYTDRDPRPRADGDGGDPTGLHPAWAADRHLHEAVGRSLRLLGTWVVTPRGYLDLHCTGPCCPPGGRPLVELDGTRVGAHMVLRGSAVLGSREELGRIPRAPSDRRQAVARVRRRWERRRDVADEPGLTRWRAESVAAWREVVALVRAEARAHEEPGRPEPACARPVPSERVPTEPVSEGTGGAVARRPAGARPWGRLDAALADRRVRDAVLVTLVPGTGDLAERSVRPGGQDLALGEAVARIVDPAVAVPPPDDVLLHEAVLSRLVALGRAGAQAPALTLLGMLAWWRGDGARARVLLERALADDAEHGLAQLLMEGLAAGVPPGWLRRAV